MSFRGAIVFFGAFFSILAIGISALLEGTKAEWLTLPLAVLVWFVIMRLPVR